MSIDVYDLASRLVRSLASEFQSPGRHLIAWDGRDKQGTPLRSGMYFVHVAMGDRARVVRITFLR